MTTFPTVPAQNNAQGIPLPSHGLYRLFKQLYFKDYLKMNKNIYEKLRNLCLVLLISAFSVSMNNVLAVEPASAAGNMELMNQAIEHSEAALKSAQEGQVDPTIEHIQASLDATDEIEIANASAMQRAVGRLKMARRDIKKGKPIEESIGKLEEAVKFLKELKDNSI